MAARIALKIGDWKTYLAANGHVMEGRVIGFWPDGTAKTEQWSARHSEKCTCHGEILPDW